MRRHLAALNDTDSDRWPFACAHVCGSCGFLQWPDVTGSPHRQQAGAESAACRACRATAWIDLAHKPMAQAVLDAEVFGRRRHGWWHFDDSDLKFSLAIGLLVLAGALWIGGPASLSTSALAAGSGLAAGLGGALWRHVRTKRARRLPARWSMVLPPTDARPIASGPVSGVDERVAPLTGRRCVAYEIAVRRAQERGRGLDSWSLVEQRHVALVIQGRRVEAGTGHLALDGQRVSVPISDRVRHELRIRGIDLDAGAFEIYESVLAPGEPAQLSRSDAGAHTITAAS